MGRGEREYAYAVSSPPSRRKRGPQPPRERGPAPQREAGPKDVVYVPRGCIVML
jgi:hypothetical protein